MRSHQAGLECGEDVTDETTEHEYRQRTDGDRRTGGHRAPPVAQDVAERDLPEHQAALPISCAVSMPSRIANVASECDMSCGIVGGKDERRAQLRLHAVHQRDDRGTRRAVEVGGRFVCEHDGRLLHQRARDRHALLLSARQLVRPLAPLLGQADRLQHRLGAPPAFRRRRAHQQQRIFHVLIGRQHRHETEALEDEADVAGAEIRQRVVGQPAGVVAADFHAAAGRRVDAADQVQQRRLAAAGRPDDHGKPMRRNLQADVADGGNGDRAGLICLDDVIQPDDRCGGGVIHLAQSPRFVVPCGTLRWMFTVPNGTLARGNSMTVSSDTRAATPHVTLRERIMGAAFDAFMAHGYAGASTLDIASRARVSKRDLYTHFASKQAMLAACIAERTDRMRMPLHLPQPRDRDALVGTLVTFGVDAAARGIAPRGARGVSTGLCRGRTRAGHCSHPRWPGSGGDRQGAGAACWPAHRCPGCWAHGEPAEMAEDFIAILWRGGLLTRLLARIAAAPGAKECERRARAATEALLRLYPPQRR